jgi:hypothetical protein
MGGHGAGSAGEGRRRRRGIELLKWRAENTPADQMNAKDWLRRADVVAGSNPHCWP